MNNLYERKTNTLAMVAICLCCIVWGFCNLLSNVLFSILNQILDLPDANDEPFYAFYVGYSLAAVPAVILCRTKGTKMGIFFSLFVCMIASYLFLPAAATGSYAFFLVVYLLLSAGMSLMEASTFPCLMAMGSKREALYRINFANAFNPFGSMLGAFVGVAYLSNRLIRILPDEMATRQAMTTEQAVELNMKYVTEPYLFLGMVLLLLAFVVFFAPMYGTEEPKQARTPIRVLIGRLLRNKAYVCGLGVFSLCIATQIMCWKNGIAYTETEAGEAGLPIEVMRHCKGMVSVGGLLMACISRFVCSALLKHGVNVYKMMYASCAVSAVCLLGVVMCSGVASMLCLIFTSAGLGMLFATLYGFALITLDWEESKVAAGGMSLAVLASVAVQAVHGKLMELDHMEVLGGWHVSYLLGVVCVGAIAAYTRMMHKRVGVIE